IFSSSCYMSFLLIHRRLHISILFPYTTLFRSSLENLSNLVDSLDESQKNITEDTEELQEKVDSVQQESDDLNNRWANNVVATELDRDDAYDVLYNTMVDGQNNPYVFEHP